MVNLLNSELRVRDLRKLVEPHLHDVTWERGVDVTSEWIIASLEDDAHKSSFVTWLNSKNISDTFEVIVTDKAWSNLRYLTWSQLLSDFTSYFDEENILVVASDRTWVMEYAPQQIARFGQW